jgi:hypothetical protein
MRLQRVAETPEKPQKTEALSVNQKLGKKRKGNAATGPSKPSSPIKEAKPTKKRSLLSVFSLVVTFLVAVGTIVPATGYAIEKWQETVATIDFSGEVDQKRPLTLPLLAKNPSNIFAMHEPRMQCSVNVEYDDGMPAHHAAVFADQLPIATPTIAPGGIGTYFCDAPQMVALSDTITGAVVPMKQAEMTVTFNYKTRVPFFVERTIVSQFVVFATSSGYRWVKGSWLGGHPTVQRPLNLESYPPTVSTAPKPPK